MDQKKQEHQEEEEQVKDIQTQTQENVENQNQPNQIVPISGPIIHNAGASAFSPYLNRAQLQHLPHNYTHQQQELQKKLTTFWKNKNEEIEETINFKTNCFPLARIKKIMKSDGQASMISAEAPGMFAKACEMFIMELTMRSWANAEVNKRKTLQKSDIASAISSTDLFDFLVDIVPREDTMEHDIFLGIPRREIVPNLNVPYYYVTLPVPIPVPPQYVAGPPYGLPRMLQHSDANQMFPIPKQENDHSTPDSED